LTEEVKLLDLIIKWLKSDWAFSRIYFLINNKNDRQAKLFEQAGMLKHIEWTRKDVIRMQYLMS